jgi:Cu/Ag efflux pump CusA
VRAQIAVKIFGDDTDTLRGLAEDMRGKLAAVPGLVDLQVEKQVLIPQITVRLDHRKAAQMGLAPGEPSACCSADRRRARCRHRRRTAPLSNWCCACPTAQRSPQDLARTLIDTPAGTRAGVQHRDRGGDRRPQPDRPRERPAPHRRLRQHRWRRHGARDRGHPPIIQKTPLPPGNFISLEGQFQAQEQATRLIAGLSVVSLVMMFLVLYSRYQSVVLAGIIMANIPLALIGSVVAMWLAGVSLSVASMVGFITLAGIATRNGILKISHYINLCKFEGERFGQP